MRVKEGNKEKDILEAAIKILAQEGYHNAKISNIAAEAGVATGSVYLYYRNKEEILTKIFEKVWGKILSELNIITEKSEYTAEEKFNALIDTIFDLFIGNPSLALVFVNEQNALDHKYGPGHFSYYEKFLDLGEKIVEEGIRKKVFNPNINTKILRNFAFGGIRHLLHQWATTPQDFQLNDLRENVKFILKKGIMTL